MNSFLGLWVIFAGFLLVHEAVLGPGGLQPVTGALVIGKRVLQLEVRDIVLTQPYKIIDVKKITLLVQRLSVLLKFVLAQELGECPFGHLEGNMKTTRLIYIITEKT